MVWLAIAVFTGSCATTLGELPFKIRNLKQGLARVESQDEGIIYSEGATFRVTRNGDCVAAGKTMPCMWFAIAFEYEAQSEVTTLTCSTRSNEPVEVVDPGKSYGKVQELSSAIVLNGKTGKAFWPGYVGIDDEHRLGRLTTVCLFEGREVLRVNFAFQ